MSTLGTELKEALALGLTVNDDALVVDLVDGRTITAPLTWFPRLAHGTPAERLNWRLIGGGRGIHWPDLDEDISVESLLAGRRSGETQESLRRWLESRKTPQGQLVPHDSGDIQTENLSDIPMDVRLQLVRDIGRYAVALIAVSKSDGERLHFAASGTLVAVGSSRYVLTAAHVWDRLKQFDCVGITVREKDDHKFLIERQTIVDTSLGPGQPDEWGQILAFCACLRLMSRRSRRPKESFTTLASDGMRRSVLGWTLRWGPGS